MKARNFRNHLFSQFLFACLILFNLLITSGCGLDTYYIIDPPSVVVHTPSYTTYADNLETYDHYFEFYTAEKNYDGIRFLGTDVYYKIYHASSRMESEYKAVVSLAGNVDTAANAPTRLIDSYKYKPLITSGTTSEAVLIPSVGFSRLVHIRLANSYPYKAEVLVGNTSIYGDSAVPVRNIASTSGLATFSFSELQSSLRPKSGDDDVDYSGSGNDNEWYVCMFAVAVAQDSTYTPIYSNVLYLGSVKITVQ